MKKKLLYVCNVPISEHLPGEDCQEIIKTALGIRGGCSDWEVIVQHAMDEEVIDVQNKMAVILGGSPYSVNDSHTKINYLLKQIRKWIDERMPLFGICFGHQLIAKTLGGTIMHNQNGRILGVKDIYIVECARSHKLFNGIDTNLSISSSHGEEVNSLPSGAILLASSTHCTNEVVEFTPQVFGAQAHLERSYDFLEELAEHRKFELSADNSRVDFTSAYQILRNFLGMIQ